MMRQLKCMNTKFNQYFLLARTFWVGSRKFGGESSISAGKSALIQQNRNTRYGYWKTTMQIQLKNPLNSSSYLSLNLSMLKNIQ
jgi:hypothetical protein